MGMLISNSKLADITKAVFSVYCLTLSMAAVVVTSAAVFKVLAQIESSLLGD